jgi:hypothetical protein
VLDTRQRDIHDADEGVEVPRDVDEPAGVPRCGEEGDPVALPSYALGELSEGEDVTAGQPWQQHDVHTAAADEGYGDGNQKLFRTD